MPTTDSSAKLSRQNSLEPLWWGGLFIAVVTALAHARGLFGKFLYWDDDTHILQNPLIRAFTWENIRAMFSQPVAKLYVPLTWLSFAVDYRI